jgi:molybdopterin-guanine dinucleotide biosynthesis protein A
LDWLVASGGRLAAIVLAGGAGRRFTGGDKLAATVHGVPLLDRVLAAVNACRPRVLVGPSRPGLPGDVLVVREDPPGGGPVAAIAAGLAAVGGSGLVVVVAGDLPFLTDGAIRDLHEAVGELDGAVFVDGQGRRQYLCGVYHVGAVQKMLGHLGDPAGQSMRALVSELRVGEVRSPTDGVPPWVDCDTVDDLRRAEERDEPA